MDIVTLCNLALMKLGKSTIVSLSDPTDEAEKVNMAQGETRRRLLIEGPWPFAIKRQELAMLTGEDTHDDFVYKYQLPTDCLKVLNVNAVDVAPYLNEYRVEGRKLLANDSTIEVRYIFDNDNESQWSPGFTRAFIDQLAYDLSFYFRADKSLTQLLAEQAQRSKLDAISIDTQQGTSQQIYDSSIIDVR